MQHLHDIGIEELEALLKMVANVRQISASTYNQAFSALLFLCQEVLDIELPPHMPSSDLNKPLNQIPKTARTSLVLGFGRQQLRKSGAAWLLAITPTSVRAGLREGGVDHRDRVAKSRLQALRVAQVGGRGDGHFAAEFLGVRSDRTQGDEPHRRLVRAFQVVEQQLAEQEVPEVVGGHADLDTLGRAHGLFQTRQVDGGVVDEGVQRPAERVEGGNEAANALL